VIELLGLEKRYGDCWAVRELTLHVARGELLVLLGSSGCGKTTTLKMINRLVEPSGGHVRIAGEDHLGVSPHELRRRIGYVFQQVGLFPHMSVADNVAVTPRLMGWPDARVRERVDELLQLVELDPAVYRERRPDQLSGGQQQRVGLARAFAAQPELVLLDEPFGALDPLTRDRLQRWFQAIRRELSLTAVFVTHDMVEALLLGDRIAVLDHGRLIQVGTPHELLSSPANDTVAELMATPRRQTEDLEALLAESKTSGSA
jgi:osmoprotectant transport system ATP-binding protein